MYVMKLKGRDGIAVYKSLHFSPDYIGNLPYLGEKYILDFKQKMSNLYNRVIYPLSSSKGSTIMLI